MFERSFGLAAFAAAMIVASSVRADSERTILPRQGITWSQTLQLLAKSGYTHPIIIQSLETPGAWIGSASKDGRRVDVAVDLEGKVTVK